MKGSELSSFIYGQDVLNDYELVYKKKKPWSNNILQIENATLLMLMKN